MLSTVATAVEDDGIVDVQIPLAPGDATTVRDRLAVAGLALAQADEFVSTLLADHGGDSRVIPLKGTKGKALCLALVWKDEALDTVRFSQTSGPDIDRAMLAFVAAHERTHCKDRLMDEPAGSSQTIEDSVYWRSEAWADAVARQVVRALGQDGVAAAEAWQTRRMFDLLAGDIQHWTTPLVEWMESSGNISAGGAEKAFAALGGESAFADLNAGWSALLAALFAGEDRSQAQTLAWAAAVARIPPALRGALPELDEIRKTALRAWPDAEDWRLPATGRTRPPQRKASPAT